MTHSLMRQSVRFASQRRLNKSILISLQKLKHLAEDLNDVIKLEKKDLLGRIENQGSDLKKKIELETNEIR